MAPRSQQYLYSYMAGLALPALYEQVKSDFADLEQRRDYLDGLIAHELATVNELERTFAAAPADTVALQAYMERLDAAGVQADTILAAQAGTIPAGAAREFKAALVNPQTRRGIEQALERGEGPGGQRLTRAQFDSYINLYEQTTAGLPGGDQAAAFRRANELRGIREGYASSGAVPYAGTGLPAELQREMGELEQAARLFRQQAPGGIRGGDAGQLEVTRRRNAPAPENTGFRTEDDAFNAALAALSDGAMTVEDFDGNQAALELAQQVYARARDLQAYQNDQRANFEDSMLRARQRLQQLEAQAQQLAAPAGMSREQELARKQAEALGYDFSKPYVRHQKSRYYSNLVRGDELYNAALEASRRLAAEDPDRYTTPQGMGSVVLPTNRAQTLARDYVAQRWAGGDQGLDFRQLEREMGKVLKDEQLQDALSFAFAFHKGLRQNVTNPTDAERQMEAQRAQKAAQERRRLAYVEAQAAADRERSTLVKMEQQQAAAATDSREAVDARAKATQQVYTRLRAAGLEPAAIAGALDTAFSDLTMPGLDDDTRRQRLRDAGFTDREIDVSLPEMFAPQLRQRVRDASPQEAKELAMVPAFQRYVYAGPAAPGGLEGAPAVEPGAFMLEQAERTAAPFVGEAQARFEERAPPLTEQQRATLAALDEDTLKLLARGGSYHASRLLQERAAAAPVAAPAPAPAPAPAEASKAAPSKPAAPRRPARAPAPAPAPAPAAEELEDPFLAPTSSAPAVGSAAQPQLAPAPTSAAPSQDLQLYLQLERDQDITGINNLVSRLGVSGTRQLMAERDAYRGAR